MSTKVFKCNLEQSNQFNEYHMIFHTVYNHDDNSKMFIDGHVYIRNLVIEESEVIFRSVRKKWFQIQNICLSNAVIPFNNLINDREEINKCLRAIVENLHNCNCVTLKQKYINSIKTAIQELYPLIVPLKELEEDVLLKLLNFDNENWPFYHYFHTFLNIHYYILLLKYACKENLNDHLQRMLEEFLVLSKKNYQRYRSPFPCSCVRSLWITIQIFSKNNFWDLFNAIVENENYEFNLWLLKEIANLQTVNFNGNFQKIVPNYALLEQLLKKILENCEFNESLQCQLRLIEPLVCDLWLKSGRIEIYQMLWEHFSKRLKVSSKTVTKTSLEIARSIDTFADLPSDCDDFELFVGMLLNHLLEHPNQWGKMKGRIYCELGPNKLKDLNDVEIYRISILFMALTKINYDELMKKFLNIIHNIPEDKKLTPLFGQIYAAFIIRHVQNNRDLSEIAPVMVGLLEEASLEHKYLRLIKNFVVDFDNVIKSSSQLQLNQTRLLDSWLPKYMASCYQSDLVYLLDVLTRTFDRVDNDGDWPAWQACFQLWVYPSLKRVCSSNNAPDIAGTLGAKIALLSPALFDEAFVYFNRQTIPINVSSEFLCTILDNYPHKVVITPQNETIALQSWIKFCLLTTDRKDRFKRNIIKLDTFPVPLKQELDKAEDPLCELIDQLSSDIKENLQSLNVNKFCEICFGQIDRWIGQYMVQPSNEAIVLRIYACIGLAFYKIGPLLYHRHKSTCAFTRLVSALLLHIDVMTGKPLHSFVLKALAKTWHLFFEATIKLHSNGDNFIEKTLRDLAVKYIPYFPVVDSPLFKCLNNEDSAGVLLEKISNSFFMHPIRAADENVFRSLRTLNDFVQGTTSVALLKIVIDKALLGLFEVVIFHNHRNIALGVIKTITSSSIYCHVRNDFGKVVLVVSEKHMSLNTTNYFQLINGLAKLIPTDLKNLMGDIKNQVSNVERMRGVGFDCALRQNIDKLESILKS